uniref:Uncharacterized protein n=1 Tax=Ixodes ricinus TaxID=34613 RepID=A0A6B0UW86_IXORI
MKGQTLTTKWSWWWSTSPSWCASLGSPVPASWTAWNVPSFLRKGFLLIAAQPFQTSAIASKIIKSISDKPPALKAWSCSRSCPAPWGGLSEILLIIFDAIALVWNGCAAIRRNPFRRKLGTFQAVQDAGTGLPRLAHHDGDVDHHQDHFVVNV